MKDTRGIGKITISLDLVHIFGLRALLRINYFVIVILVTGKKVKEVEKEFFITLTEVCMKENGLKILNMDKVFLRLKMVLNILALLIKIVWLIGKFQYQKMLLLMLNLLKKHQN